MTLTLVLITLLSVSVAGAMSMVAWRAVRNERRRSEARVAALAAELEDSSPESPSLKLEFDTATVGPSVGDRQGTLSSGVLQSGDMFATDQTAEAHSRIPIAIAAGSVIVASVVIVVVLLSAIGKPAGSATTAPVETPSDLVRTAPTERAPDAAETAVELVALGHHRDDRRLTVEGVVRNPASGTWVPHLSAVVLMFNSAGTLVATERTPVESSDLEPGSASRFAVSVPGSDIVRYRVSFRTDEHVVPHVDKRNGL